MRDRVRAIADGCGESGCDVGAISLNVNQSKWSCRKSILAELTGASTCPKDYFICLQEVSRWHNCVVNGSLLLTDGCCDCGIVVSAALSHYIIDMKFGRRCQLLLCAEFIVLSAHIVWEDGDVELCFDEVVAVVDMYRSRIAPREAVVVVGRDANVTVPKSFVQSWSASGANTGWDLGGWECTGPLTLEPRQYCVETLRRQTAFLGLLDRLQIKLLNTWPSQLSEHILDEKLKLYTWRRRGEEGPAASRKQIHFVGVSADVLGEGGGGYK